MARCGATHYAGHRRHARDFAFNLAGFRTSLGRERNGLLNGEDGVVARPRRTTAERVRLVLEPPSRTVVHDPAKPDPRLIELVRVLARQAAKDFIEAEGKREAGDRLPE